MGQTRAASPVSREEVRGDPMLLQGYRVTTVKRVTRVHWPGGVWEWHRPAAVEVQRGAIVQRVPIRDTTRILMLATAAGLVVGFGLLRRLAALSANER
jgi:hypothetical protein